MSTLTTYLVNNPLEQFEIFDFVYILAPVFGFTKLSFTNIGFYFLLGIFLVISINVLSTNNGALIPSRWAIHSESVYGSILNMVRDQVGAKNEVYVPFIFTLFNFILFSNLAGLVPYSFTTTSHLVFTISLSTVILIGVTIIGFQKHGLGFFAFFVPAGTPLALVFLLVAIEVISYLARALSLGLRLGANMIAGHSLLKIISTFTWKMVVAGPVLLLVSVLPVLFLTALVALELVWNDAPEPWQLGFQDGASPSYEGIVELHDQIMFYLVIILLGVTWVLSSIILNFNSNSNKIVHKYHNHGTLIELIWTITPAFVLIAIAFPSFKLLYLMDEVIDPAMTIKALGHQWYWSYEYSDFVNEDGESIEFDSYLVPTDELEEGQLRLLEVDNRVVVPVGTHIRFIVTGADVIHSFAVPALGLKIDAIPGRLNQTSVLVEREGVYYGQCSEICGVHHGFMPIAVEAVSLEKYLAWLNEQA
ncbi:hypothetical protein NQZ79_g8689 [Umbelopsis isabellina]|nr:hypothetical protein NQZ79_g8689 [Umbelopsis isabellina]